MDVFPIAKWVITLIGAALLGGAYLLYDDMREFIATAAVAQGTVVSLRVSESSDSVTYSPVFRFSVPDGREIEVVSSSGSNPPNYSPGEAVEVLYLPDDPYTARINGFFSLWGGVAIVGGLGAIFFAVGAALFVWAIVERRSVVIK